MNLLSPAITRVLPDISDNRCETDPKEPKRKWKRKRNENKLLEFLFHPKYLYYGYSISIQKYNKILMCFYDNNSKGKKSAYPKCINVVVFAQEQQNYTK